MSRDTVKFYEVVDEALNLRRWHLEEPRFLNSACQLDFWPLISGEPVDEDAFRAINAPLQREGQSLNFTFGAFLIPYVTKQIGDVILSLCGRSCSLLPCLIGGENLDYFVLVVARKVMCLDRKKSLVEYYRADELFEGEEAKIGKIKSLVEAKIEPDKVPAGVHLFRLEEDLTRLVASETLALALKRAKVSGVSFERI